ncbi:MAG: hypothetical protein C4527_26305 [Candidatus Omnitrophota bacterium]|nr:MAG: hypothetical protein C4527_26305 [Candidatus Omnitrophota bacterium]
MQPLFISILELISFIAVSNGEQYAYHWLDENGQTFSFENSIPSLFSSFIFNRIGNSEKRWNEWFIPILL